MEPNRIEPSRAIALQVWWAWFWRAAVGTFLAGGAVGLLAGILGVVFGFKAADYPNVLGLVSLLIAFPVSVEMLYRVLRKRFSYNTDLKP